METVAKSVAVKERNCVAMAATILTEPRITREAGATFHPVQRRVVLSPPAKQLLQVVKGCWVSFQCHNNETIPVHNCE